MTQGRRPRAPSAFPERPLVPSFDPRQVPVEEHCDSLAAVEAPRLTPDALRARFRVPPFWQPEMRGDRARLIQADARPAAVLMPVVVHASGPTLLLTQRTDHLRHHSGQIAFPGGRAEPEDRDAAGTALRETQEEIGLGAERIEIVGVLPEYHTITGYRVTPVIGLVTPGFTLHPDPDEVAEVFEVPLGFLMDPRNHQRRRIIIDAAERTFFSIPYSASVAQREYFIWGATAAMLRNLYRFLSAD